jgi:hypothetical protein
VSKKMRAARKPRGIFRLCRLLAVSVVLAACGATSPRQSSTAAITDATNQDQQQTWKALVGKWYGQHVDHSGNRIEWVIDRRQRGAYQVNVRTISAGGRVSESIEVGEWGVSGRVYFTIFKGWMREGGYVANDPADPSSRDAFHIVALTEDAFTYEHVVTGNRYTVKRVPGTYELPSLSPRGP